MNTRDRRKRGSVFLLNYRIPQGLPFPLRPAPQCGSLFLCSVTALNKDVLLSFRAGYAAGLEAYQLLFIRSFVSVYNCLSELLCCRAELAARALKHCCWVAAAPKGLLWQES